MNYAHIQLEEKNARKLRKSVVIWVFCEIWNYSRL